MLAEENSNGVEKYPKQEAKKKRANLIALCYN